MAQDSKIEWTHHTFNPWIGCARVSPACDHCYAEAMARRRGWASWGVKTDRHITTQDYWRQPHRWNRAAEAAGVRRRVFCASLADVFEDRRDLDPLRERLWTVIEETPALDWLLLTKRPTKVPKLVPWTGSWPGNVWLGATAEDQRWADKRAPALLGLPAAVRFLSVEPVLGLITLREYLEGEEHIDWVIVGGESGARARPPAPEWIRAIRDECVAARIPFFFKQWGTWGLATGGEGLVRLGKKEAGRQLDRRIWNHFPLQGGRS